MTCLFRFNDHFPIKLKVMKSDFESILLPNDFSVYYLT